MCLPRIELPSTYTYRRYSEVGALVTNTTVRLDHVVTVIDLNPSPTGSGTVSIWNVPNVDNDTQIYAFSFNQAKPSGAALNWDAIFESVLVP